MSGEQIANLIYDWADRNRMHPDDFGLLFANELVDKLKADKAVDHSLCDECGVKKSDFTRESHQREGGEYVTKKQHLCVDCIMKYMDRR